MKLLCSEVGQVVLYRIYHISENSDNPIFGVIVLIHFSGKLISFCQTIQLHTLDDRYLHPSKYLLL